jgi:hypothetical protein
LDREEEGDKCMEDGMGGGHVFVFGFFFLEIEGLFLVIFC